MNLYAVTEERTQTGVKRENQRISKNENQRRWILVELLIRDTKEKRGGVRTVSKQRYHDRGKKVLGKTEESRSLQFRSK